MKESNVIVYEGTANDGSYGLTVGEDKVYDVTQKLIDIVRENLFVGKIKITIEVSK